MRNTVHFSWRRIPMEKSSLRIHLRHMIDSPQSQRPICGNEKWMYWISPLAFRRATSIVISADADFNDPECVLINPRPPGRVSRKRLYSRNVR